VSRGQPLARRPQDYPWSSDQYYRRGQAPEWLDVDHVLPLLGQSRRVAAARYQRLMGGEVEEPYESLKAYAQAIKGNEVFAKRLLREAGVPPVVGKLTEERIVAAVAAGLGIRLEDLGSGTRQRVFSRARLIAAYLGRAVGAIPVSRMAKYFGREESTFVRGVLRLEEKLASDSSLPSSNDNTGSTRLTPPTRSVDPTRCAALRPPADVRTRTCAADSRLASGTGVPPRSRASGSLRGPCSRCGC